MARGNNCRIYGSDDDLATPACLHLQALPIGDTPKEVLREALSTSFPESSGSRRSSKACQLFVTRCQGIDVLRQRFDKGKRDRSIRLALTQSLVFGLGVSLISHFRAEDGVRRGEVLLGSSWQLLLISLSLVPDFGNLWWGGDSSTFC
jgi:hypothetical protein